jgi:hypothetical protein
MYGFEGRKGAKTDKTVDSRGKKRGEAQQTCEFMGRNAKPRRLLA